jgi:hypothetical protein
VSEWWIQEVDDQPLPNLDIFVEVMKKVTDHKRIVISYKHLRVLHDVSTNIIAIDRHSLYCSAHTMQYDNKSTRSILASTYLAKTVAHGTHVRYKYV